MDINDLSKKYDVRILQDQDVDSVYELCRRNRLYYEYCPPFVTRESIREDMRALPPGIKRRDKYYVGFYLGEQLIAVMDLIDGYPEKSIAFIGFFMTDTSVQKNGLGSEIIEDTCEYLKLLKYDSVRLAWVKGNPQSEHFWLKNHFRKLRESSSPAADSVILAERILQ